MPFCVVVLGLAWVGSELANHFLAMPRSSLAGQSAAITSARVRCRQITAPDLPSRRTRLPALRPDGEVGEVQRTKDRERSLMADLQEILLRVLRELGPDASDEQSERRWASTSRRCRSRTGLR